ncbi:universal stress protein [Actinoplanes derwentensis]|uniref:Nucleotide-binding universal stress protein, UspA family n=1 Tax=Actinoplanes derwentensis TaxID=113562 RepID=A0A1H1QS40_9ACTN|nr:universal stress protein [Actinoplanes derwentensis]GID89346.1 universal stress protein [Actinoplanes derwentensis]SDS26280.1 Nucleotide-binding universal stress protein, UspA family [Actinoplanes derwentensis]
MSTGHVIVVGVDGSEEGRRALEWAADEAAARGGSVRAVIAWSWDGMEYGPIAAETPGEEEEQAERVVLEQVRAVLADRTPGLPVSAEVIEGNPAEALTTVAAGADMLVLGSHGRSRVLHTVLGSVSESCIRRATCPVVVIPAPVREPAEVY